MSVADLVGELENVGVRLWEESGNLRFRAPKGVLTEKRMRELRAHKAEILDYLKNGAATIVPQPEKWHEPFPLTDVQAAYLIGRRDVYSYGGVGCHGYGELAFAELDPVRVETAWRALVWRHHMLRVSINPDGSQRILPEVRDYVIRIRDLGDASPDAVTSALAETRAEMDHRNYQPDEWPLFELRITLTDARALLHFSVDFLIADFISIQILLGELYQLYSDPASTLPALDINFRDYLLGERRAATGARYDKARAYWWSRLDDLPGAPELPVLGATRGDHGERPRFRRWQAFLNPATWAVLRRRAGQHGITPAGAVLAAYAEVIGRWSGNPTFTLNVTLLNRLPLHPQVGALVGDFTSVSLLAVAQGPPASFADRARALQDQLWQDLDHRMCSGIEVIRELARRRGSAVLMPVVFTSAIGLDERQGEGRPPPPPGEFGYGISQTPQVWIDCQNIERSGGLATNWDVREGVFPDGMVEDMFVAYERLLRLLADDDAAWREHAVVALPVAQAARRAEVNDTGAALPDHLLHDEVVARALRTPDRVAVIAGARRLTYGELLGHAVRVADRLREQGCQRDHIVAISMDKGLEQVVAVLGTVLTGAAYLPIDTNQPLARRGAIMDDAGTRHVLTQPWLADDVGTGAPARIVVDLDATPGTPGEPLPSPATRDDLAYVIYTSGSTGSPKGVMISHRGAVNTVEDINGRFGVTADDRILGLANLGFDLSVYDIFGPLGVGGCLVLPEPERGADPSHWADLVATHGITLWNSVPAQLQMLADYLDAMPETRLPTLRLALLSGDWIPVPLPTQIRNRLSELRLVSLGGATEASIWSIHYPIGEVPSEWPSVPYGKPLANQTFQVLDDNLRPCPDRVVGGLYIGGSGLANGYLGEREKTTAQFIRHPVTGERLYRTGDLGRYLPDGNIEFLGRRDSQVKIRGHRIELAEVETALLGHPAVGAVAVLVDGQQPMDRRLVAFVESARSAGGRDDGAGLRAELSAAATAGGAAAMAGRDPGRVVELARRLDAVALLVMANALRPDGLFDSKDATHSLTEILAGAEVAYRFRGLVRRWCGVLERNDMLVRDRTLGRFRRQRVVDAEEIDRAWAGVDAALRDADEQPWLVDYFRGSAEHLPELMRGELDAVQLLFPQGTVQTAEAAFRNNIFSRYGNQLITAVLRQLARRLPTGTTLRILDIGAGHWGASVDIVPALADLDVNYLFTEVSDFFLNQAREQFAEYRWVRFAAFDMNDEFRRQGMEPNSFDIVVCANGLHYARDKVATLGRVRELLRPPGWLVFSEMTRENYQVLTSLEFLFDDAGSDPDDEDGVAEQNFLSRDRWLGLLASAGAETQLCAPEPDDAIAELGVDVFAASLKTDRERVDVAELVAHAGQRLPDYMLPSYVQVVEGLPLTRNGKIDHTTLRTWLPVESGDGPQPDGDECLTDLEARLAEIWAEVLPVRRVGRDADFFALGGDSLLSAQLVGQIVERVPEASTTPFDDLLRQMLSGPTVAELAASLTRMAAQESGGTDGEAAFERPSPLLHFDGGAGDVLRVLVHDGIGTLSSFGELPAALARGGPLIGLTVQEPARYLGYDRSVLVELVADTYVRLLLAERFERFHVVGGGVTGLLATEVARQLIECGAEVTDLTIVAGYHVPQDVDDPLASERLFAATSGVNLDDLDPHGTAGGQGPDLLGELARRLDSDRYPEDDVLARFELFRHTLGAVYQYQATSYAGDISYVGPAPACGVPWQADVEGFWRQLCLGEFRVLPADDGNWVKGG